MNLHDFRWLADENLHSRVISYLRSIGFDVVSVREEGWSGATDIELLRRANDDQRVIVSHDADFGLLTIRQRYPVYGILYLRPGHMKPEQTIVMLQALMEQEIFVSPPFLIVTQRSGADITIRVKTLPQQTGDAKA